MQTYTCRQFVSAFFLVAAVAASMFSHESVQAQTACLNDSLFLDGTFGLDEFASAAALSGEFAVVGAQGTSFGLGAAYVFHNGSNGWTLQSPLVPSGLNEDDLFGTAVAIDGDTIVVGAPGGTRGKAFVFTLEDGNWVEEAELSQLVPDGDPQPNDPFIRALGRFGHSVAMNGNRIVVGGPTSQELVPSDDPNDPEPHTSLGAAYVFHRVNGEWQFETALASQSNPSAGASFGWSVSMDDESVAIGAPLGGDYDNPLDPVGMVHVFAIAGSTWSKQAEISKPEGGSIIERDFGESVAVRGDTLLIGSPGGDEHGAAFVFRRTNNTWAHESTLTADAPAMLDEFGRLVALSDRVAMVSTGPQRSARFFEKSGSNFTELSMSLSTPEASAGSLIANTFDINGDRLLVGTPHIASPESSGTAYVFDLKFDGGSCNSTPITMPPPSCACGACAIGQGLLLGALPLMIATRGRRRRVRRQSRRARS